MTQIIDYKLEFISRTKRLIEDLYSKAEQNNLEYTFLINCTLGLIVAVSENLNYFMEENSRSALCQSFKIKLNCLNSINLNNIKVLNYKKLEKELKEKIFNDINLESSSISSKIINIELKPTNDVLNYDFIWLINKLRNSIAHQNIKPINNNGLWNGVKFRNYNNEGIIDFQLEIDNNVLKDLAIEIANMYINNYGNE